MIAVVEGTVLEKSENEVVLMAGGVGFRLLCSMSTVSRVPAAGQKARLYTYLSVREDALELYGFESGEEKAMFRRLISVSGIGPRSALGMLGSMPLSDLRMAILTGDLTALSRAPGVGKKTAQRIALELKDKVTADALGAGETAENLSLLSGADETAHDPLSEAMLALKSLGYTPQEAAAALKGAKGDTADELIRAALRSMVEEK